ncbi:MAG: WXG100 family type VII secretion target [Nocardiopsaceae bacterium]|nr:WXG100 family type VII secretion target [Nocardiopsaceae bacterium]
MSTGNDYTRVNFGGMGQAQADFQRTYTSLQNEIDQLESQLNQNLGDWTGQAQQVYLEVQQQWQQAMANMQAVIQSLGSTIGTANDNYQAAEAQNASRWAG